MGYLRNSFKVVIVTGVPGVGKTTVLSHLSKIASSRDMKMIIVNFGDFMTETAMGEGIIKSRDELRRLPLRKQLELQSLAAYRIIEYASRELGNEGILVIDTHAIVKTPAGYLPGLPGYVLDKLKPDTIVVIEAEPEIIVERQARDKGRYRADFGGIEGVRSLLSYARTAAIASSISYASTVLIVYNREGEPEAAALEILKALEAL
ncbi:MAG: adenylate kinase [Acidilobaceae archaeon]